MQRNSIIIGIVAGIVLVIVIFGMFVIHRNSVSSPTSSSPVVVHRISSSTIKSNISASEIIIIKMQTKNVTALVESKGYSEQGFYVCMEIYNPFPRTFNNNP
jgi:hypothetical protein